jgi:hypothetical protein
MPNSFIAVGFENWLGSFCSNIIIIYFFSQKWKIENLSEQEMSLLRELEALQKYFLSKYNE